MYFVEGFCASGNVCCCPLCSCMILRSKCIWGRRFCIAFQGALLLQLIILLGRSICLFLVSGSVWLRTCVIISGEFYLNMYVSTWMCLRIRSDKIIDISVMILTVLTGVDTFLPGYVSSQVVLPSQDFSGHSEVFVVHFLVMCILWWLFWLERVVETFS